MKPAWLGVPLALVGAAHAAPVAAVSLDAGWSFRLHPSDPAARAHPEALAWRPARTPGVVQTDLLAAGLIKDPYVGLNEASAQWVGLADWDYRRTLEVDPDLLRRRHLDLVFDGLDTFAEVRVNGRPLITADNQFRRWRADARAWLHPGANTVEVAFRSPIRALQARILAAPYALPGAYDSMFGDEPPGKQTSSYVRKAPYAYGWDWGPRLVTEGIWLPVRLEGWDDVRLEAAAVHTLAVAPGEARIEAVADVIADAPGPATVSVRLTTPDGRTLPPSTLNARLAQGENRLRVPVAVPNPKLWWPAGYGVQPLYTAEVRVSSGGAEVARQTRRFGLRTVELRRGRDAWGRSFAFVINGTPVFAKGANLIPSDMFAPRLDRAKLLRPLEDARAANMNMLRVWGGGYYLPDAFYARADELGVMLWQEFMFGGAVPPYDAAFKANVGVEAREQARRLGDHPSIVLFCGNNEVQTGWEHWDDRLAFKASIPPDERDRIVSGFTTLFGQVLRDAAAAEAPQTPYWATSPGTDFDGDADRADDGDMHFWKVWGGAPVADYLKVTPRFMSEYGLQSMPDLRTIRSFAGQGPLSVDAPVIRAHQKYDKGAGGARLLRYIREGYGEPRDFDSFVYLSQVMQAEGIELAALHHRASRPRTMGSLFWQLNDVWPGASWSSVDGAGRWKPLQFHARRFFAPVALSALHDAGAVTLTAISDRSAPARLAWRVRVVDLDGRVRRSREGAAEVPAASAVVLARLDDADLLAGDDPRRTLLVAELMEGDVAVSRALVGFTAPREVPWPDPDISTAVVAAPGGGARVTLSARRLARAVWVDAGPDATLSDNAFDLLPGETRTLDVRSSASADALRRVLRVRSLWNATSPASQREAAR